MLTSSYLDVTWSAVVNSRCTDDWACYDFEVVCTPSDSSSGYGNFECLSRWTNESGASGVHTFEPECAAVTT